MCYCFYVLMTRGPLESTRSDTPCPTPTLFRSPPPTRPGRAAVPPSATASTATRSARPARPAGRGRAKSRSAKSTSRTATAPAAGKGRAASRDHPAGGRGAGHGGQIARSEEHTSELQSLMRISYAVFCLKKKKKQQQKSRHQTCKNKKNQQ